MNLKNIFFIKFSVFILILLMFNSGFSQGKKEEIILFSGIITRISNDYKFIVVHEVNILISPDTKIVSEKGKSLKIDELRSELFVKVEGVQSPNGFLAKRITVKKTLEV